MKDQIIEDIKNKLSRSDIKAAFKIFNENLNLFEERDINTMTSLSGRFNGLSRQRMSGIISFDHNRIEHNRIVASIMDLLGGNPASDISV